MLALSIHKRGRIWILQGEDVGELGAFSSEDAALNAAASFVQQLRCAPDVLTYDEGEWRDVRVDRPAYRYHWASPAAGRGGCHRRAAGYEPIAVGREERHTPKIEIDRFEGLAVLVNGELLEFGNLLFR